jgi:hypothetical protein
MNESLNKTMAEKIKNEVLALYKDTKDVCLRKAVKQWEDAHFDPCMTDPVGELFHAITSPEMMAAAIAWHQADIEENAAINRREVAGVKVRDAMYRFRSALAEIDGVCITSDDMYVNIPRLEVWRSEPAKLKRILPQKVASFCRKLAKGEIDIGECRKGHIPNDFKELQVIGDFVKDILDFIEAKGEQGAAHVSAICDNGELAQQVAEDEAAPAPIRFLAKSVATSANLSAKEKSKRPVGFNAVKEMY